MKTIVSLLLLFSSLASGLLYGSPTGSGTLCSADTPCSLAYAVSQPDDVLLLPGRYAPPARLPNGLCRSLRTTSGQAVIADTAVTFESPSASFQGLVFERTYVNLTVGDYNITDCVWYGHSAGPSALEIFFARVFLRRCEFFDILAFDGELLGGGAAIKGHLRHKFTALECAFRNVRFESSVTSAPNFNEPRGGALQFIGSAWDVTLRDSLFYNCSIHGISGTAEVMGGAFSVSPVEMGTGVAVSGCVFEACHAIGLSADSGVLNIESSYNRRVDYNIDSSLFVANYASSFSDISEVRTGGTITFNSCFFANHTRNLLQAGVPNSGMFSFRGANVAQNYGVYGGELFTAELRDVAPPLIVEGLRICGYRTDRPLGRIYARSSNAVPPRTTFHPAGQGAIQFQCFNGSASAPDALTTPVRWEFENGNITCPSGAVTTVTPVAPCEMLPVPANLAALRDRQQFALIRSAPPTQVQGVTTLPQLDLEPGTTLAFDVGAQLIVLGDATLAGDLVLNVSASGTLTVIQYQSATGNFSSVTAVAALECQDALATPVYGATSLSVTITIDDTRCNAGALSQEAIIGIGAGAGALLLIGIIVAIACGVHRSRKTAKIFQDMKVELR